MRLIFTIAAFVIAAATGLALGPAPAMASSQPLASPEIAWGALSGQPATAAKPVIPLAWRGMVNSQSTFAASGPLPKKGQSYTFATSAGKLTVAITAAPVNIENINTKACYFTFATYLAFTVVSGKSTGGFARASGSGEVQIYFAGYGPRYASGPKKGQCNTSPSAPELAKGAVASFVLSAVLKD